jgi:hypothetical protein
MMFLANYIGIGLLILIAIAAAVISQHDINGRDE